MIPLIFPGFEFRCSSIHWSGLPNPVEQYYSGIHWVDTVAGSALSLIDYRHRAELVAMVSRARCVARVYVRRSYMLFVGKDL